MQVLKVFVRKDNQAMVRCPFCAVTKDFSVASFKGKSHSIKLRCACKRIFQVDLDFRRAYRKNTKLAGYYAVLIVEGTKGGRQLQMYVDDLSLGGIGMTTVGPHGLKEGALLTVEFVLNDPKRTSITKKAIVRRLTGSRVGCEFVDKGEQDRELGFFLMP
jgi:hypothetical protein